MDVVNVVVVGELFSSLGGIGGSSELGGASVSQRRSDRADWGGDSTGWGGKSCGGGEDSGLVEGILCSDSVVKLREAELAIVVSVGTTEEGEDLVLGGRDAIFLEEGVDGVNVEGAKSVDVSNLEEVEGIEVVTVSQVLSEGFNSEGEVDFLLEDTSKGVFDFVAEDFVSTDEVGFSLSDDLAKDAVGLGEEDVEELSVAESVISNGILLLEDESELLLGNRDLVFSEEVDEVDGGDVAEGVTVDSLEGSVWLESSLFGEDLSDDFDLLFTVGDSLEEVSELELGLDAWHLKRYDGRWG